MNSDQYSTASTQDVDIAQLGASLWHAKIKIMIFVAIVVVAAFLFVQVSQEKFASSAQILIEAQETSFTRPEVERQAFASQQVDEQAVLSQLQIIGSRDIALTVIERLELAKLEEFNPALANQSFISKFLVSFGLAPDPMTLTKTDRVYREFAKGLTVYPITGSRVIVVEFRSSSPQLSADIVSALVQAYLEFQSVSEEDSTRRAGEWLEAQINDLRAKVEDAEAKVARFRSTGDILLGVNNSTLISQRLSELSTQLTRAEAERAEAAARANEIRSLVRQNGLLSSVPEIIESPLVQNLQEQIVTQRARIAELSATLLPRHPRLLELQAQLNDLQRQARSEIERVARGFDNEARVSDARAESLRQRLAELKAEASRSNEAEVELRALEREAASQRDLLESYLTRYREATARGNAGNLPVNAKVIQRADVVTTPVSPNGLAIILSAFIGAVVLAVLFVVSATLLSSRGPDGPYPHAPRGARGNMNTYRESYAAANYGPSIVPQPSPVYAPKTQLQASFSYVDQSLQSSSDILAAISETNGIDTAASKSYEAVSKPVFYSAANDYSEIKSQSRRELKPVSIYSVHDAASLNGLCDILSMARTGNKAAKIAVLSADDTKSFEDFGLAVSRVQSFNNHDVVFVDADFESKSQSASGLTDLISGTIDFDEAIQLDDASPIHILERGKADAPDLPQIAGEGMKIVLGALSEVYDFAFIHVGSLNEKALAVLARCDACIIVASDTTNMDPVLKARRAAATLIDKDALIVAQYAEMKENIAA